MSDNQSPMKMFTAGFSCAQIVASYCAEACGNDPKTARIAMGGFGGGMNCGEVCGAVSGAIYSLGVHCQHCEYDDFNSSEKVINMTNAFTKAFKDEYDTLLCKELAPEMDMSNCHKYIKRAKELAMELIEKDEIEINNAHKSLLK